MERLLASSVGVLKEGERGRESFNPRKIRKSIQKVCKGRKINEERLELLVTQIEAHVLDREAQDIHSKEIAQIVFELLSEVDYISSERFAANYKDSQGNIRFEATNGNHSTYQMLLFDV